MPPVVLTLWTKVTGLNTPGPLVEVASSFNHGIALASGEQLSLRAAFTELPLLLSQVGPA